MLLEQMKTENYRKLKLSLEKKEKVNTNFGPEENEQTLQEHQHKVQKTVSDIKSTLEKQILDKYQKAENERIQERIEDLETIKNAKNIMIQEKDELVNKDKNAKSLYKDAWKEQIKMKQVHKQMAAE